MWLRRLEPWRGSEGWRVGLAYGSLASHGFSIAVFSMVASAEVDCSVIIAHAQTVNVRRECLLLRAEYSLKQTCPLLQFLRSSVVIPRQQ